MPNLRGKTWTTTTPATVGDAQYWEDHLISDTDAAKIGTAVQTVNNTAPDASGNVDVVALPAGGTTGQVLTKQSNTSGDADWEDPASSGHTIEDEDGNTMPYQTTLQFLNADVSNDSVNSATVVDCKGAKGDAATVSVGTTSTLPAGSSATVTNSGTSSAAVFNFGIPAGANGTNGTDGADGADGVSVTGVELLSTSGKVKTYRMSFSDGNHFDYQVTDGSDGTGAGDMLKTDYDSASAVYSAGGIPAYVTAAIGALDGSVSGTPGTGKTLSAFSETNGVVSATFSNISITKSQVSDFPTIPTISDSYDGTSSNGMSGKAVKGALETLDVTVTGMGTGKTLASLTETDGKIAATFSDISITKSQVSDFPTIPTVNNSTITLKRDASTTIDSFTTNTASDKTITLPLDEWTASAQADSSGTFVFDDLSNLYGYDLYCEDALVGITGMTKGTGTNTGIKLTYTTNAANGTYGKLRILK